MSPLDVIRLYGHINKDGRADIDDRKILVRENSSQNDDDVNQQLNKITRTSQKN